MRDMTTQPELEPFGIRHVFWLSSRDVRLALDDSLMGYRAVLGEAALLAWEPVSYTELISFHRQLFMWKTLVRIPAFPQNVSMDFRQEKIEEEGE